ncbi:lyase [Seminavis robusta]|uniref:DNA-(apurinic or apyrimidinic site) endonuclease n=1 Tax=Seminavis robusta TaxID=568900 RepID=A0A9N8HC85_9STRA|nr:lyase [Seminavis robusta]|eukprot:Sro210_g087690.1 lyase (459) ;mRNA; r:58720-60096
MPRSSPRLKSTGQDDKPTVEVSTPVLKDDIDDEVNTTRKTAPKKRKTAKTIDSESEMNDEAVERPKKQTKATKQKAAKTKKKTENDDNDADGKEKEVPKKKSKKAPVQCITERDELPKLWSDEKAKANGSYTLKIATWNVAGLRAILKKDPHALATLVTNHNIDILCLQETKLQESHLDDPKLQLRGHLLEEQGYDAYYSCATAKKGYAGTAVFVKRRGAAGKKTAGKQQQMDITSFFGKKKKKKNDSKAKAAVAEELPVDPKLLVPEQVTYGLGAKKHDGEGRVIVLDFPGFTMANLYVPNSGQKLERLDYRTEEWDKDLLAFMQAKQKERGVPVLWLGDLNVAHKHYEAYNFGAKHLDKQAGLTAQERASFQAQLDAGFVDAFRHFHPNAKGHYTYWSQRAGNREPNKGLRLDYFVCDSKMLDADNSKVVARDSYMIPEQMGSDHGPAVLELEIKP